MSAAVNAAAASGGGVEGRETGISPAKLRMPISPKTEKTRPIETRAAVGRNRRSGFESVSVASLVRIVRYVVMARLLRLGGQGPGRSPAFYPGVVRRTAE